MKYLGVMKYQSLIDMAEWKYSIPTNEATFLNKRNGEPKDPS